MAKRKILFYQLRPTRVQDAGWVLDRAMLIDKLSSMSPPDRKVFPNSDNGMIGETIAMAAIPAIRFSRCRRVGLPFIEKSGELTLDSVGDDESRAEATHVVFFQDNVIGAEITRDGLRPSSLITYFNAIIPDILPDNKRLRCAPLYVKETLDYLDSAEQVRSVEIKFAPVLHPENADNPNDGPEEQLSEIARGFGGTKVGFSINNRNGLSISRLKDMLSNILGTYPVSVAKARIRLDNDQITDVDFIKGHIGSVKDIDLENGTSGSVRPSSAFEAISTSYSELAQPLAEALTVYQEELADTAEQLE